MLHHPNNGVLSGLVMTFHRRSLKVCFSRFFPILVLILFQGPAPLAQDCAGCLGATLPGTLNSGTFNPPGTSYVSAGSTADPWTIRKRVDEVTVFFTVTNGHKFVDDITQADVNVTDDHKPPAKVSAFGHERDLPLRMGLLVDTSNSIHYRFRFEQEAASRFLRKIVRPQMDRAFVMGFSDHTNLTKDYSDDPEQLAAGVSALRSEGGTALYDAVRSACGKLASTGEDEPMARTMIVLSDGEDNASKAKLEQVIETAQRQEVTVYTISTNNSGTTRPGDKILKELALQTGGRMFSPNSARDVVKAFTSIEEEMRNRYALSYRPSDLRENGRYRPIEIIAHKLRKRFRVHARKGYYAPQARSAN
jgi:Ca-activated chloride channel family protein